MSRNTGDITKKNILTQSFVLFSSKPYDKVTFTDFEKMTGLSRGAILYHFKSKQEIFEAVIESSVLGRMAILEIPIREKEPLKNFITDFIKSCVDAKKEMAKLGIKNMNRAHYNIESLALYSYSQFNKMAKQLRDTELKIWILVVKKAQDVGEIKRDIDPELTASLFLNSYLGHAYSAAKEENGCDTELLYKELMHLREIVKS